MGRLHENVRCHGDTHEALERVKSLVPGLRLGKFLGGGCIAQVYAGELDDTDGSAIGDMVSSREVVVKVRRSAIVRNMDADMTLLRICASLAEWWEPDLEWLSLQSALDDFGAYLMQQTDLLIEAANLRRFAENFHSGRIRSGRVRVPRVLREADDYLVTEVAAGVSLASFIRHTAQREEYAELRQKVFEAVTDMVARMALRHNFIHGDLHPGNIFVDFEEVLPPGEDTAPVVPPSWRWLRRLAPGRAATPPTLTLIDAGIAIEPSGSLNSFMEEAMRAALRRNHLSLGRAVVKLHEDEGLAAHSRNLEKLELKMGSLLMAGVCMAPKKFWSEIFSSYEEYRASHVSEYFNIMLGLLREHRIRVSPPLWSLMVAFGLIEGSVLELGFGINVLRTVAPYVFRFNPFELRSALAHLDRSEQEHKMGRE